MGDFEEVSGCGVDGSGESIEGYELPISPDECLEAGGEVGEGEGWGCGTGGEGITGLGWGGQGEWEGEEGGSGEGGEFEELAAMELGMHGMRWGGDG